MYYSKMIFFIFTGLISIIFPLPSDEMWKNFLQFYNDNKMLFSSKTHFIYDELNYTGLYINDTLMQELYQKQENIYKEYNIYNYIFAVKYINESLEPLGLVRNHTRDNLRNNNFDVDNSIFTVVSVESVQGLIYTGKFTRKNYISNEEASVMKEKLLNNIKNKKYYNAWNDFLEDTISYSKQQQISNGNLNNTDSPSKALWIVPLSIFGGCCLISICATILKLCKKNDCRCPCPLSYSRPVMLPINKIPNNTTINNLPNENKVNPNNIIENNSNTNKDITNKTSNVTPTETNYNTYGYYDNNYEEKSNTNTNNTYNDDDGGDDGGDDDGGDDDGDDGGSGGA